MKKLFLKLILLFSLLLGISLLYLALLPLPVAWGDDVLQAKYEFYRQHAAQYNTLFIGSSRIYRHISPQVFDQQSTDIASFNLGASSFFYPKTDALLREILADKPANLKYVIFEFDDVRYDPGLVNLHTTPVKYWYTPESTYLLIRSTFHADFSLARKFLYTAANLVTLLEKYLNVGLAVDQLTFLNQPPSGEKYVGPQQDGFYSADQELQEQTPENIMEADLQLRFEEFLSNPRQLATRLAQSEAAFARYKPGAPYNRDHLARLSELISLAEAQNVKLIFLLPPRRGQKYDELLPVFYQLPAQNRIELANPQRYPELYAVDTSFDVAHLTHEGATIFTRLLAEQFGSLTQSQIARDH